MDVLTKELQSFLVQLGMSPDSVGHQKAHYTEHLLGLLVPEDEEAVNHYFGVFGHARMSLHEIASERGLTDEKMMETIDTCLRRLAVTPEWQVISSMK